MRLFRSLPIAAAFACTLIWSSTGMGAETPPSRTVPGVVIDYSPASSRLYVGSPGIAVLPNGDYLAKLDLFGPASGEGESALTRVLRSRDRGKTWARVAEMRGMYWATIFVHKGDCYLIGTDREYGRTVIRRSADGGDTWTTPTNASTGVLLDGKYHCAPVPVVVHNGRIWRAMEDAMGPGGWGSRFRAFMMSAPVDADLLRADSWTKSNPIARDKSWNNGDFGGWLEGNAVITSDGKIVDILRVATSKGADEKVAVVRVSDDGKSATFDPATGIVPFPGGAKKFTIRWDTKTQRYWSVVNWVPERHRSPLPSSVRNTLALASSPDLQNWEVRSVLLYHPDTGHHGFQYVDWLFEGEDLLFVSRTAYDDEKGGAHDYHDANYLTFHRVENARTRTMADSVPMPELPLLRHEIGDFVITGQRFEIAAFATGQKAFSNRDYVWEAVPSSLRNHCITRVGGGTRAEITVTAKRDATLYMATAMGQGGVRTEGWRQTSAAFRYTDAKKTTLAVFRRDLKTGESVVLPQGNWSGTLAIFPDNANVPQK